MVSRDHGQQRHHAMSRFAAVTKGVIDACQQGLARGIPDLDASLIAVITEESLEANRLLTRSSQELLLLDFDGLSDWSLAVLADLYATVSKQYLAKLEELRSRTHGELATLAAGRTELARIGDIVDEELTAALWFRAGEGERCLRLLAALLEDDPSDIWTYNWIAIAGDSLGLSILAREAARRGLLLIEARGDTQKPEHQLRDRLARKPKGGGQDATGRWPEAVNALRAETHEIRLMKSDVH